MSMSFKIGDLTIHRIIEQEGAFLPALETLPGLTPEVLAENRHWLAPKALDAQDTLIFCFQSYVVRTPHHTILVDSCIGNDKPRPTRPQWNMKSDDRFMKGLAAAGLRVEDIDFVMCTHLHVDHVGWNTRLENGKWVPTFPKARYLISRREYDFWSAHDDEEQQAMLGDSVKPIFDAGLAELVELDHVISPEIRLTPSIGHTPGHVSVMIESEGERAVITGDMTHHPCQLAHPDWSFADTDPTAAVLTRSRLFADWADQPILVIGTHFPAPTAGQIHRDGAAFRFAV
jgi:glyoxylase-like metal-dependent hydrolase (beta-lactamase superfamily II)